MLKMISNMFDLNQSVLSGAIDIIVVRQKDGSLNSTSFHVRFGSLKIVKSKEKVVNIEINGNKTNEFLKLSSTGDAYFTNEEILNSNSNNNNNIIQKSSGNSTTTNNTNNNVNNSNTLNLNHTNIKASPRKNNSNNLDNSADSFNNMCNHLNNKKYNSCPNSPTQKHNNLVYKILGGNQILELENIVAEEYQENQENLENNNIENINNIEEYNNLGNKTNNNNINKDNKDSTTTYTNINKLKQIIPKRSILVQPCSIKEHTFQMNKHQREANTLNINQTNTFNIQFSLSLHKIHNDPLNCDSIFNSKIITEEEFYKSYSKLIKNLNLAVKYNNKIYPYKVAHSIILSLVLYQKEPPISLIQEKLNEYYILMNSGMFSYFKSKLNISIIDINEQKKLKTKLEEKKAKKIEQEKSQTKQANLQNTSNNKANKRMSINSARRTFNPNSRILERLNLQKGKNTITFVCNSRLTGENRLESNIFLWDYTDKIVISDVDGTITRSDVLGQIFPLFGKDWSHSGVTQLFKNIEKNNYKILYLTARALCQSKSTKSYLSSLKQNNVYLPDGPLLMNPDGLVSSFKREVIDKTPQNFKIACLLEVRSVFNYEKKNNCFYSGFGNRKTVSFIVLYCMLFVCLFIMYIIGCCIL